MKLRILKNSLRVRLSADEVQTLLAGGRLENRTCFGADEVMTYSLEISPDTDTETDTDAAHVSFYDSELRVQLTESLAEAWSEDIKAGIRKTLETPEGPLELLIEKDRKP